jgi:ureidoacrylate peracid hydrolase
MIRGTKATEIWPTLAPEPGEAVVTKNRFDAFLNTELDQVLRLRCIEHVLVCGILTNYCVETTAKSAMQRDYRVTVLEDATNAMSADIHSQALDALRAYAIEVISSDALFDYG